LFHIPGQTPTVAAKSIHVVNQAADGVIPESALLRVSLVTTNVQQRNRQFTPV
jgi:hypothetical protein